MYSSYRLMSKYVVYHIRTYVRTNVLAYIRMHMNTVQCLMAVSRPHYMYCMHMYVRLYVCMYACTDVCVYECMMEHNSQTSS